MAMADDSVLAVASDSDGDSAVAEEEAWALAAVSAGAEDSEEAVESEPVLRLMDI